MEVFKQSTSDFPLHGEEQLHRTRGTPVYILWWRVRRYCCFLVMPTYVDLLGMATMVSISTNPYLRAHQHLALHSKTIHYAPQEKRRAHLLYLSVLGWRFGPWSDRYR